MKTMNLVGKVEKLLRQPPDKLPLKKLRKTIKSLKHKQELLEEKLKRTRGKRARRRLQAKIDVLRIQRAKGAETYRRLIAPQDGDAH